MSDIQKMIRAKCVGVRKSRRVAKRDENYDYYELCRRTDPSFTKRDVIEEWCSENPDGAMHIVWDLELESDAIYDSLDEVIGCNYKDAVDAFVNGYFSSGNHIDFDAPFFTVDGYGHVKSLSEKDVDEMYQDLIHDCISEILDNIDSLPAELQEILELWDDKDVGEEYVDADSIEYARDGKFNPHLD